MEIFLGNEMMKRALGMTCINVGELVKVVTDDTRKRYKDFPWKPVAGMRDITAHRYQTLRMEDVYNTVCDEYPKLMNELKKILEVVKVSDLLRNYSACHHVIFSKVSI